MLRKIVTREPISLPFLFILEPFWVVLLRNNHRFSGCPCSEIATPRTGTGDLLISVQAVEPIKIPPVPDNENMFELFIKEMDINPSVELETKIDNVIFDLYGLNQEEREFISENYH